MKIDPGYLIPLLVLLLMIPVSAKDGDPCTSASDCDAGTLEEAKALANRVFPLQTKEESSDH